MRHGRDASFVTPDASSTVSLSSVVQEECDRLGISGLRELFEAESGAARQRELRENEGVDALCEALCLD
jgi:carboxylate-amine ligase